MTPLFILEGEGQKGNPFYAWLLQEKFSLTVEDVKELYAMGLKSVLLFKQVDDSEG